MHRFAGALVVLACGVLVAGCADQQGQATPITPVAQPPARPTERIVVQRGQSLNEIANRIHVAKQEIIELNHLPPRYILKAGATLVVPVVAARSPQQAKARSVVMSSAKKTAKHDRVAEVKSPSERPAAASKKLEVIPLD